MFVSASTECFPELSPPEILQILVDLQFTAVELAVHEEGGFVRPSEVLADIDKAAHFCRDTHRLDIAGLNVQLAAEGEAYYKQFEAISKMAKVIKVVTIIIPSAELGTPFNEEIERLRRLVNIASLDGAVVCVKTEIGRMTEDPSTAVVLCDNVKGLRLSLDPSHYIAGPHQDANYDKVFPYVQHVHLRDSTKETLQVRVGQGEVDYGRLLQQLAKAKYDRALSVNMEPIEGLDHRAEMRKIRLLLDSLL
ncbi:MAG: sugar phosphate isomerase/epimerase [Pirellulales bacterium]|nr:sugar phosphate isomerase/epimerase [Pirellulales bacterium]